MSFKGGKYSRKIELKSLKSQQYLRKVFKCYLGIIFSFLNALLRSCICHAARLSILFSPIQIFISKKMKIFILQIIDFQFVSSCFVLKITVGPRYVRIRKKKKATISDNMKTTEARLHADDGQELWNVKEGIRLSIQQRLVVFSRSLFASLLHCIKGTVLPFFFPLPPSLNWYPPSQYFSLFHIEFLESFAHFHQHDTLFFLPMRATFYLASFSRHNFGTRFF